MNKLLTALRGGVREAADVLIDVNGLRIFEQEIASCEEDVRQAKVHLAHIVADRLSLAREVKGLEAHIITKEQSIGNYLKKGNETGALGLAELLAAQEKLLLEERHRLEQVEKHEHELRKHLQATILKLESYRSELRALRSTSRAQKTRGKLSVYQQSSHLRFVDMQTSLQRIREKQQYVSDHMQALEQVDAELSQLTLHDNVVNAPALAQTESAKDIVQRLRITG